MAGRAEALVSLNGLEIFTVCVDGAGMATYLCLWWFVSMFVQYCRD
jgi:hypothetical protein